MFHDLPVYPDMTDTLVGWAPRLPRHWGLERGKSLFERVQREPLESDGVITCFRDGVVTLRSRRRSNGFTESLKEIGYQGIRKGDLVIHAMDAFAGAVGVSDSDGKGTPVYSVCVPKRNANPHYYSAVVREMARSSWILALSKGVRERSTDFRFDMFGAQMLPVPTASEQAAIVKYLAHANARIDQAIAAKRRLIALLEEQQLAILNRVIMIGIGQPNSFTDSGVPWIGAIPDHWELVPARYIFSAVSRPITDSELPQLSLTRSMGLIPSGAEGSITKAAESANNLQQCEPGDFVLNKYRAHLGLFRWCREPGLVTKNYTVLRPRIRIDNDYFEQLFMNPVFAEGLRINARGVGDGMSPLYTSTLLAMKMPLPPLQEQRAIVDSINSETVPLKQQIDVTSREIRLLSEFRARLVADVVTGQVDVRAIAATLPDVPDAFDELDTILDDELEEGLSENLGE